MKISKILIFFVAIFFISNFANASSLIGSSNCIMGGSSADGVKIVTVNTVGSKCTTICNDYCAQKFKIDIGSFSGENQQQNSNISRDLNAIKSSVISINQDRIEKCLSECYQGKVTSTSIRIPIQISKNGSPINDFGIKPEPWACDVNVSPDIKNALHFKCENSDIRSQENKSLCSNKQLSRSYIDAGPSIPADTAVAISIANYNPDETANANNLLSVQGNNIYLCGFKTVMIAPNYIFKNYSATYKGSTYINSDVTNNMPITSELLVKNGDFISIKYYGKYCSDYRKKSISSNSYYCNLNDDDFNDFKLNVLIGSKVIDFETLPKQLNDYPDSKRKEYGKQCSECIDKPNSPICSSRYCSTKQPTRVTNGLSTYVSWNSVPLLFTKQLHDDDSDSNFRSTTISGNLKGISDTPQELKIFYNKPKNLQSVGGYFVSVEWKGCNYRNGERLEYTVFNDAILNSKKFDQFIENYAKWQELNLVNENGNFRKLINVNKNDLNLPNYLEIDEDPNVIHANNKDAPKGKIYFRIKPLSDSEANSMGVSNYSRADTIGQYYLKIQTEAQKGLLSNFVAKFEKFLKNIVDIIFKGFTSNQTFLNIVKLVLILYVGVMGMFFVAGISPINQKDGIVMVFKIAIVLILISQNSLIFFKTYFFDAFGFDEMKKFANLFTPDIDINIGQDQDDCFADNSNIKMLCVLQKDLNLFFSWPFWNRIFGMLVSGFLLATIAIIAGVVMYIIVILKVTFLYCMAMLSITVTLALAPIFIPMILFKYTKTIFDAWLKQLIAFILQPIFIFTAVALFRLMFLTLVQSVMGKSACKICWLDISLPFGNYCLFNSYFYVPLSLGSSPGAYSLPMTNIGLLVALFFVGYGMHSFCDFASSMATRLINFSSFNIASTGVGPEKMYADFKSAGSTVYNAATLPLDVLAVDDKSRSIRRHNREEKYAENKKKEKK